MLGTELDVLEEQKVLLVPEPSSSLNSIFCNLVLALPWLVLPFPDLLGSWLPLLQQPALLCEDLEGSTHSRQSLKRDEADRARNNHSETPEVWRAHWEHSMSLDPGAWV